MVKINKLFYIYKKFTNKLMDGPKGRYHLGQIKQKEKAGQDWRLKTIIIYSSNH